MTEGAAEVPEKEGATVLFTSLAPPHCHNTTDLPLRHLSSDIIVVSIVVILFCTVFCVVI